MAESDNIVPLFQPEADIGFEVSEDYIARQFTAKYGNDLRFDVDAGRWFVWDGVRWRPDAKNEVRHKIRLEARRLGRGARSTGRHSVIAGVEKLLQSDPAHAVNQEKWDSDRLLLGTPEGTIDLRTGQLRTARREDFITKIVPVAPASCAPTRFLQFLDVATGGDLELVRYLQQLMGYCLTGDISEHAFFFIYGPGGNGKSVFLNILRKLVGDYGVAADMETFTPSNRTGASEDLARLKGARVVIASETEPNRKLAIGRVKNMTGGEPITARFLYQNSFTYFPQFKPILAGNTEPIIPVVEEAMRRRTHIVPFVAKPDAPDKHLEEKLTAELGQILNWAIQGCRDWQQNGLLRPVAVASATESYLERQDTLGQWLEERCDIEKNSRFLVSKIADLRQDFESYATEIGRSGKSQNNFSEAMKQRGFSSETKRFGGTTAKVYYGVSLKGYRPSPNGGDPK